MGQIDEGQLHAAIWALHEALQRRDGIEQRLRSGDVDADLYSRGLQASEAVVTARLELYRVLIEQGWTPPSTVTTQVNLDTLILAESGEHLF